MIICLEGPDGAGKSTLAESLRERLTSLEYQVELRHCGPPRGEPLVEYEKDLDDYNPQTQLDRAIIYDRHVWGELVYGPLLRGEARIDAAQLLHVELYLRSRGAILAVLTHDLTTLRARLETRGDDLVKASHLPQILYGYRWLIAKSILKPAVLTDPGPKEVAGLSWNGHQQLETIGWLGEFPSYIGAPNPAALLVGDEPGPTIKRVGSPHAACFIPYREACGYHLMKALLPLSWVHRLGVVNSKDVDLQKLWFGLGRPKVVALGAKAHERLAAMSIAHARVPHPQYARRFHHGDVSQYTDMINIAAKRGSGEFTWK